jgi:hypothetical protein
MKNFSLVFIGICISVNLIAQTAFDSLTTNHVKAVFCSSGEMFHRFPAYHSGLALDNFRFPGAAAGLWIGGYDGNNQLHISAQTYRQSGADFWAGAMDTVNVVCSAPENLFYDKIWESDCDSVQGFLNYLQSQGPSGYHVPYYVQNWPGNGDVNFNEAHYLAPFYDADGDGYYNWTAGDMPIGMGQQSLFYVFNDSLANTAHNQTNGRRPGIEIHATPYAFNLPWDNAVSHTVFIHYTILNRSTVNYDSTIVGFWSDIDPSVNSHFGTDSLLGCYYNYDSAYASGIVFLNHPMKGAMAYENDFSIRGNPFLPGEFYQYMNQCWKDNSHLTYGGNGYNGNVKLNWMYCGDPTTSSDWNETVNFDQRAIGATNSFSFPAGNFYDFDIALVLVNDTSGVYNCVTTLKQNIQDVKNFYANESQFCTPGVTAVNETAERVSLSVFPDPATTAITLRVNSGKNLPYAIFNTTGKLCQSGFTRGAETIISVESLSSGMYFLRLDEAGKSRFIKFIKQDN